MKNIYFSKIQTGTNGMTNQLISFISNIILARQQNKRVIIVDKFLNDYSNQSYSIVSNILDLDKINVFLEDKYGIKLIDRYHVNFKLLSFKYGFGDKYIDITNKIMEQCYNDGVLTILNTLNLNELSGDPCPGQEKKLYIKYFLNDVIYDEVHNEKFNCVIDNIILDFNDDSVYLHRMHWINYLDREMFDNILKNIVFNKYFMVVSNEFVKCNIGIGFGNKINVIHLRLEDDALEYWGAVNKMNKLEYKYYIESKYINLIINHIGKDNDTIILSYCLNNNVIEFLKNNNYKFHFVSKQKWYGREQNAIIDILVAQHCNNVFIGNFHVNKLNGSTFSYFILQKLDDTIKKIMLDLDNIINEPSIGYNSV